MEQFDQTTMPIEAAFNWDPNTVVGRAISTEDWKGIPNEERLEWIDEMNSGTNDDTFVSKLISWQCFLAIVIRGGCYRYKFIVLEDFQRFVNGPIFEGPMNWPDNLTRELLD